MHIEKLLAIISRTTGKFGQLQKHACQNCWIGQIQKLMKLKRAHSETIHHSFMLMKWIQNQKISFLEYDISSFRMSLAVESFYINYIIIHEKTLEIECFWSCPFWFLNLPNLAILEVSRSSTENSGPNLNWLSLKLPFLVSEFAQSCNFESLQEKYWK